MPLLKLSVAISQEELMEILDDTVLDELDFGDFDLKKAKIVFYDQNANRMEEELGGVMLVVDNE